MANVMATPGTLCHHWYALLAFLIFDGDLALGPVTGTYYILFQKEISNILTVTPSLINQTHRIITHNFRLQDIKV